MRLLGDRDHRMTRRYAAITPEIVAEEYQNALAKLATKYRLPPNPPVTRRGLKARPSRTSSWTTSRGGRKHAPSSGSSRDLLRRIERLRREVQNLTRPTKK